MQKSILKAYPDADISVGIIWINILKKDTEAMAVEAAGKFIADSRVHHFYDPEKMMGKSIAGSLGSKGEVAWDTYLFYKKYAVWDADPPGPDEWMHQLKGSDWASPAHYYTGDDLVTGLKAVMDKLAGMQF